MIKVIIRKSSVCVAVFVTLFLFASFSAFILSRSHASNHASAANESVTASVTVDAACTMSTGGNTYTDSFTVAGGTTTITGDTIAMSCNDSSGFDVYAIGHSGDMYYTNNTDLIFSGNNATYNIKTDGTNGTSYWKMKIETSGTSNVVTIDNNYDDYSNIPSTYTKIAHFSSNITSGYSSIAPTYQVYVSSTQPYGSYTGKVKYAMVHPNNAAAPALPPAPPTTCNTKVPGVTYMQDITSSNKAIVLASLTEGSPYYLYDSRDNEPYCVSKLKDGNLWMLDNLRLGDTSAIILTPDSTNLPSSVTSWTLPASISNDFNSYYEAQINIDSKNDTTTSYGVGSGKIGVYYNYCAASAGYFCTGSNYTDGSPDRDICPKGWRIPTGYVGGEYDALFTTYSSNVSSFINALSTPLSGRFITSSASKQGSEGYFWSSSMYDTIYWRILDVVSYDVGPASGSLRNYGLSTRCILK